MTDEVAAGVRALLAEVLEWDAAKVADLPGDTGLFGGTLGLTSLTGTRLLARIQQEYGVDVAAEDLTLDSMESIDTLAAFVAAHRSG